MSSLARIPALPPATPQDRVLDAALIVFCRYGFRRTTMALVAEQAGLSRPAVYLRYANKQALFQAAAEALVARSLDAAAAAWRDDASLADNLAETILAKDLEIFRLLKTTPHGKDLMAIDAGVVTDAAARLQAGFSAVLVQRAGQLEKSGQLDLAPYGGANAFARLVQALAAGLKHEFSIEADYEEAVRALARLIARAT